MLLTNEILGYLREKEGGLREREREGEDWGGGGRERLRERGKERRGGERAGGGGEGGRGGNQLTPLGLQTVLKTEDVVRNPRPLSRRTVKVAVFLSKHGA